jgi:hypothetical protein
MRRTGGVNSVMRRIRQHSHAIVVNLWTASRLLGQGWSVYDRNFLRSAMFAVCSSAHVWRHCLIRRDKGPPEPDAVVRIGSDPDGLYLPQRRPLTRRADEGMARQHMKTTIITAVRMATAAATVAFTALIAVPTTAHAGVPPTFQSPSGNILCWINDSAATCRVTDHTYARPLRPADCTNPGWGNGVWMDKGEPPFLMCGPYGTYSGMRTDVTLDYGQTRSDGPFSCDSETSGVTCTDSSTGHFFRISRDSYQLG